MNVAAAKNQSKKRMLIILGFGVCALVFWGCVGYGAYWALTSKNADTPPVVKKADKVRINKKAPTKPKEEWLWHDFQDHLISKGESLHRGQSPAQPDSMWFGPDPVIPEVLDVTGGDPGYFLVKKLFDAHAAENAVQDHKDPTQKYVFAWGPYFFYRGDEKTLRHYKTVLEK